MENRPMSSLSARQDLSWAVQKRKVRKYPLSSGMFRYNIWEEVLKRKIKSFEDVKEQYEESPRTTTLFIEGLVNYMSDNSNYPYGFYPEGVMKIENCYPDDDTWRIELNFIGAINNKTINATIKLIHLTKAIEVVEEHLKDTLCFVNKEILLDNIREEEITDMMEYLKESNQDEESEEEDERKIFECEECPVCYEKLENSFIPKCGHPVCLGCKENINKCPTCRGPLESSSKYYDEAKEYIENVIDEAVGREDNEQLDKLIYARQVAVECIETDGFAHSIGFEYEVEDWDQDHYWVLKEN